MSGLNLSGLLARQTSDKIHEMVAAMQRSIVEIKEKFICGWIESLLGKDATLEERERFARCLVLRIRDSQSENVEEFQVALDMDRDRAFRLEPLQLTAMNQEDFWKEVNDRRNGRIPDDIMARFYKVESGWVSIPWSLFGRGQRGAI